MIQSQTNVTRKFCQCVVTNRRCLSTLLIAEHNNQDVTQITRNAITASKLIGGEIHVLVAGEKCREVSEKLSKTSGITKILEADNAALKHHMAENLTLLVLMLQKSHSFTHILAGNTSFSRALLPRVAGVLQVSPSNDIISIKSPNTFSRYIYSGSAIQTVTLKDPVKILTIRGTSFEPDVSGSGSAKIEVIPEGNFIHPKVSVVSREFLGYARPKLEDAEIVVGGGRGLRSRDNFKLIYDLADKLKAAVGCTRAIVDAGFVPADYQIGQTGKVIAPRVYFAIGISGAIQHVAGIRDCKKIVAINKDKNAKIFEISDYGLVTDLFKAVPEIINKL